MVEDVLSYVSDNYVRKPDTKPRSCQNCICLKISNIIMRKPIIKRDYY